MLAMMKSILYSKSGCTIRELLFYISLLSFINQFCVIIIAHWEIDADEVNVLSRWSVDH